MNTKANYFAVGVFVTVLSTALVAGILWISAGGPQPQYDRYTVFFTESVSGLSKDGAVKYRGVDVGKIVSMKLDDNNPERVRLELNIKRGTPVKEDTIATLSEQGLTGLAHVSLTGGSRTSSILKAEQGQKYPVIPSKPSKLVQFGTQLTQVLEVLTRTGTQLNALLNESNRGKVAHTLENLESISTTLAGQSGNLEEILSNLSTTVKNTHAASADLPEALRQFRQSTRALEDMAKNISMTAQHLEKSISVTSRDIEGFTNDALPEATLLVNDLRKVVDNLHGFSEKLKSDPSVLLYGTASPEPGPGEVIP
jgi:phospholipid/cholesterol/gamma-HCH transport system substrate-binding protein